MLRIVALLLVISGLALYGGAAPEAALQNSRDRAVTTIPPRTIVLTFDDAVKSHLTIVAPMLRELGFQATFFITQKWMEDKENFLTWEEVAEIHRMGFEIGNHTWTHADFGMADTGAKLGEELQMVEKELARVGVPKPISFAWCGNTFGPEALAQLGQHGYKLARRGMQPEKRYGTIQLGPSLNVSQYHPLLIPTTGDAYPDWTFAHFKTLVASAKPGEAVVVQFHGVPDKSHPWVHTPPEAFRQYMTWLKENGYRAIAMRDLLQYYDLANLPDDPMLKIRLTHNSPAFRKDN